MEQKDKNRIKTGILLRWNKQFISMTVGIIKKKMEAEEQKNRYISNSVFENV